VVKRVCSSYIPRLGFKFFFEIFKVVLLKLWSKVTPPKINISTRFFQIKSQLLLLTLIISANAGSNDWQNNQRSSFNYKQGDDDAVLSTIFGPQMSSKNAQESDVGRRRDAKSLTTQNFPFRQQQRQVHRFCTILVQV
jgi:hypothetical protein